jgi:transcriptional regulator with XRE-family HTH domain
MARVPRKVTGTSQIAVQRVAKGWTQEDLARVTGIPLRTVQRIEQGRLRNPGILHLQNIAIALDVDLETILRSEWRGWHAFDASASAPPTAGNRQ